MINYIEEMQEKLNAGNYDDALKLSLLAREDAPGDPDVLMYSATIYKRLGRFSEAIECCKQIVKLLPTSADAYFNLGVACVESGDTTDAELNFYKAIELNPADDVAHYKLACILHKKDDKIGAIEACEKAVSFRSDFVEARKLLVSLLIEQGDSSRALELLNIDGDEDADAEINYTKAYLYEEQCKNDQALVCYRKSLNSSDENSKAYAHIRIGGILLMMGEYQSAQDSYQSALQLDKESIEAKAGIAGIYERTGETERAYQVIEPYLENDEVLLSIVLIYSRLCKKLGQSEKAIILLLNALEKNSILIAQKRSIHFSLGRLFDDKNDYAKAFEHYRAGNNLKSVSFDAENNQRSTEALIDAFSQERLIASNRSKKTNKNLRPIFIVGMPRSGTSLAEQIITSHLDVEGGGELDEIPNIVKALSSKLGTDVRNSEFIMQLTPEILNSMTKRYMRRVKDIASDKRVNVVTDKLPGNFIHLGLIELLFPKARIIHCVRQPLDTCLSCYFTDFGASQPFSYNLSNLGSFYNDYEKTMRHWKSVLKIPIYDLCYEKLLAEPESEIRKLLSHCRLDWDERCMNHHKQKRHVKTASYAQATKPLYKSSINKAENYKKYLGELGKELK